MADATGWATSWSHTMSLADPITFAVIKSAFDSIADEMATR